MRRLLLFSLLLLGACAVRAQQTFTNPLLPGGADPWVIYQDGFYYYMHTTGHTLKIWKTKSIADLKNAESKVVWTPPDTGAYSREIWAPEIHFINRKWYIYFAADDGSNAHHRLWVLENASADPLQGTWTMKGKVADATDQWAIDGSVFEHKGKWYIIWSGWEKREQDFEMQNIYIAALKNPWTIEGPRVKVSSPELPWERIWDNNPKGHPSRPVYVNEGPEVLAHGNKLFLVYSASGCWTNDYKLGMLTANANANLLDPKSWTKSPEPVFVQSPENHAYGTGHNSFFKSPSGKEDWILYHANPETDQGCGAQRSPRAQRISWKADGTPDFGIPVATGQAIAIPK
ncbi:glycosyl hydrolase family 43 [Chitinophaga parva]|uniref:Glycosyl hydrolase family 43 n=1 Tax=Chitinophaga parva TaxID=2169414 RepID=A0A2T7BHD7_9BACT|nr:glycoside hydrolase family 43 protein [Chitinophaga parva]PUZ25663.1 glycosyl hydrolase family 43 [Chitinophaga parva]